MTKREAAIVSAYTGILLSDLDDMYKYVEEIMGRPVFTHELPNLSSEIQNKSRQDFINIVVE